MSIKTLIATVVIAALIAAGKLACIYHDQLTEARATLTSVKAELNQANNALNDMQERYRAVSEIDARHRKDLDDARLEINALRDDVATGNRRLQLHARCEPVRQGTTTAAMGDGASPRLTDAAKRDYFTLRERIERVTAQLGAAQDYIRTQCMK